MTTTCILTFENFNPTPFCGQSFPQSAFFPQPHTGHANTESGMKALNDYLEQVNRTSRRRINVPEVLEFAVQKLSDKDIRKIQERAYTPDDKMELMLEEYNQLNPEKPLNSEGLKAAMVEMFQKQVLSKAQRSMKLERDGV